MSGGAHVVHHLVHFKARFAQAQHDAGLGEDQRVVASPLPAAAARHSSARRGGSSDRAGARFRGCGCRHLARRRRSPRSLAHQAPEIGGQDLDRGAGRVAAQRLDHLDELARARRSGRSSRSTEVMTICSSPSLAAASATCSGSIGSTGLGMPVLTLQNAQARVQVSPRIITVACFLVQHSPMFGQAASSHTVLRRGCASGRASRHSPWWSALSPESSRACAGVRAWERSRDRSCSADRRKGAGLPAGNCIATSAPMTMDSSAGFDRLIAGYRRFRADGWAPNRERWATLREGQEP
jgi:hypothetical protein